MNEMMSHTFQHSTIQLGTGPRSRSPELLSLFGRRFSDNIVRTSLQLTAHAQDIMIIYKQFSFAKLHCKIQV